MKVFFICTESASPIIYTNILNTYNTHTITLHIRTLIQFNLGSTYPGSPRALDDESLGPCVHPPALALGRVRVTLVAVLWSPRLVAHYRVDVFCEQKEKTVSYKYGDFCDCS